MVRIYCPETRSFASHVFSIWQTEVRRLLLLLRTGSSSQFRSLVIHVLILKVDLYPIHVCLFFSSETRVKQFTAQILMAVSNSLARK